MYLFVSILLLFLIPSMGGFIYLYAKLFDIFQSLNQETFYIVIAIIFSTLIVVIVGMMQIISSFYFSKEVHILTPYPLKTNNILLSKFFVMYVWQIIIGFFTVLPLFIIYGIKTQLGIMGWFGLSVSFMLLPIMPLSIIGIIVVFIMRLTNAFRHKDAIRLIGMLGLLAVMLLLQLGIYQFGFSIPAGQEEAFFKELLENNRLLIDRIQFIYPVVFFVINAIEGKMIVSILSLLALLVVSIITVYLFTLALRQWYINTYLSEQESIQISKKKVNTNPMSTTLSITKIDFVTLLKVPIYALNCLSTAIIVPILLIFTYMFSADSIQNIEGLINEHKTLFWLMVGVGLGVYTSLSLITSTSFSREGKTSWIMRTLPIKPKEQIWGRVLTAMISEIAFIVISLVLLVIILKQDYLYVISAVILAIIVSIPLMLCGLYIDLKRPMLKWDNPQQPVKQNMNALFSILLGLVYGTIMYGIYYVLQPLDLSYVILFLGYIIVNFFVSIVVYKILHIQFEESLLNME